jgi:hypothetical protein
MHLEHTCVQGGLGRSDQEPGPSNSQQVPTSPPVRQLEFSAEFRSKVDEPNWCALTGRPAAAIFVSGASAITSSGRRRLA